MSSTSDTLDLGWWLSETVEYVLENYLRCFIPDKLWDEDTGELVENYLKEMTGEQLGEALEGYVRQSIAKQRAICHKLLKENEACREALKEKGINDKLLLENEKLKREIEKLNKEKEFSDKIYKGLIDEQGKLVEENEKLEEENKKLTKDNKRVRKEERRFKKLVDEEKIVTQVLEDFLDRRMGYEGCFGEGIIPDSRPSVQVMEKYPTEYEEVIYKRYGKIDEEDPKHVLMN